jgi:hypothetical protein
MPVYAFNQQKIIGKSIQLIRKNRQNLMCKGYDLCAKRAT